MPRAADVECVVLMNFGGYTRDSLGDEPAAWVLSMYRRLNPPEPTELDEEDLEARAAEQEALFEQGLTPQQVSARMRQRR